MTMDMTTGTITEPMAPAEALSPSALLQLLWLASPALPVGGFSYSEGLEAAIESGLVRDDVSAGDWLLDQLKLALARADLAVAAAAHEAWQQHDLVRVTALNDWVRQTRESSEMRLQTEQMGRSLQLWLLQRQPQDPRVVALGSLAPAPTWPVAFALAALHTGAPRREALLAHAFGWAENMVQAAIKSVPLGQSAGQRMLARLVEALPAVIDATLQLPDDQRQACTPMLAILSAQHEAQYSRLFRS
ncbi:urease accessory protein UreF [Ideonella sp.]|uniref:urease accessory protein UreF n=2 Tax=Ideonella sp. TaxID=1929293 RepID=UPI00351BBF24